MRWNNFAFCIGDDTTDEDMFKALIGYKEAVTIKVGPEASYAQYNLHTPHMVVALLEGMAHLNLAPQPFWIINLVEWLRFLHISWWFF